MTDKWDEPEGPLWQKWAWFIGLWLASIGVISLVAYGIRWWLN
jgi:hypothetical protein